MGTKFRIGVNTAREILSNPPPQFRHVNLIFAPFGVRVGNLDYPIAGWTDFAGVFLFRWYAAVLKLSSDKSRYARLPFWYTYEMWLRRTSGSWWRLSLVEREADDKTILQESLIIPEVVEAALLTAIQQLLAGARSVGVQTEDCVALEALLKGRESYLEKLEAGKIPSPSFLSGVGLPRLKRDKPASGANVGYPTPQNGIHRMSPVDSRVPQDIHRRRVSPPVMCPRCGAVLGLWSPSQTLQTCPLCRHDIRLD
jgi:hypothetical protein